MLREILFIRRKRLPEEKDDGEMNIYVGNLPFSATEDEIRALFADYGQVTSAAVIKDKFTGQSRGFAFVEMTSDTEAQKAIAELNGKDFKGRALVINPARPREERSDRGPRPGGFGGGGDRRGGGPGRSGGDRRGGGRTGW